MKIFSAIAACVLAVTSFSASAASVQEELVILQDKLYETIQSVDPDSIEKFSALSAAITVREDFVKNAGKDYIIVNKRDYILRVIKGGNQVMENNAVIGRPEQPTPLVDAAVTRIVLNPGWTVSENTALLRIAPRFAKDPNYATAMGYKIYNGWGQRASLISPHKVNWQSLIDKGHVPYKIYQEPGRFNSLGQIKFVVPNTDGIFIHGSPYKSLFDEEKREFSSGCIRIPDTIKLASLLLTGVSETVIQTKLKAGKTVGYNLKRPFKFYVVDWPVVVDTKADTVAFLDI